jgi:hypothetical protein
MARININEFSGQAGGMAYRVNQVRTDPAVVKAAQDAWGDVRNASRSCSALAREVNTSWQRSRTTPPQSGGYHAGHTVEQAQDRPAYPAAS